MDVTGKRVGKKGDDHKEDGRHFLGSRSREPPCRGSGIEVGRLDNAFWAEPDANGATLHSRNGYDFDRFTIAVHSRHRSVDTRANAKLSSLRGPNTGAAPAFHTSAPSSAAPGSEQIIETFYQFPIGAWKVMFDYQFVVNPAYNRDRGPVSIGGIRLHSEF